MKANGTEKMTKLDRRTHLCACRTKRGDQANCVWLDTWLDGLWSLDEISRRQNLDILRNVAMNGSDGIIYWSLVVKERSSLN